MSLATAAEGLCTRWSEASKVGELPIATIMEASGIALSRSASRLYHINDGDGAFFHVTDIQGGALQTVRVTGFMPQDIEDLGLGPCGTSTCLYLADTGDNAVRRQSVQIAVIKETERFGAEVAPERVITARYPDGPHDAEAIAIHPSGDLLLATKMRRGEQGPSLLFRLSAAQLAAGGEQTFAVVGTIPVPALTEQLEQSPRRVVTAMNISPDGRRFVLLTYDAVIEFAVDLKAGLPDNWVEGKTHHAAPIAALIQAEAIAYERDGRSILYSTESVRGSAAPLMRQSCME
ncbi:MAG: hypothetical protein ABIP18_05155 [Steroidobacteraceae bacterium]